MQRDTEKLEAEFLAELSDAIENDRLTLPTLPEVALQIREAMEDPEVSVNDLSAVIGKDAALAARIIKVANSPLMRGRVATDNLQQAIMRMGLTFVRNLATGLAMEQIFQATNDWIDQRLRRSWEHSIEVASISHVLTMHYTRLKPDQATLAGLVHEIGILPILTAAEDSLEMLAHPDIIERVIERIHPKLGSMILRAWDFPEELAMVPENYLQFQRDSENGPDYGDVVTVANLQSYSATDHPLADLDWSQIPAFAKLGLSPEVDVHEMEELGDEISEARSILS